MTEPLRIDRIPCPAVADFERDYVLRSRPVVLQRGLGDCAAASWTPESLRSVVGAKTVKVAVSEGGSFNYDTERAEFEQKQMRFGAAVDLMRSTTDSGAKYYIMQRSIGEEFPELADDLTTPAVLNPSQLLAVNLWYGSAGTVTPLHFDENNNLLGQVHGRKAVSIFSPDQTPYVYPQPAWAAFSHVSQVDPEGPDDSRFPLFKRAIPTRVDLEPGDMLFLPAFWWHHVRSLEVSISVNFWWKGHASQFFAPNALRRFPSAFDRNRLADLEVVGGLEALANYALREAGLVWVAVLCAAGALEQHLRKLLRKQGIDEKSLPRRLTALHSRLSRMDEAFGSAIGEGKIDAWTRLVSAAREANDLRLSSASVGEMVDDVARLIRTFPA